MSKTQLTADEERVNGVMQGIHEVACAHGMSDNFKGILFDGRAPRGGNFDALARWMNANTPHHLTKEQVIRVQQALLDKRFARGLKADGEWSDLWEGPLIKVIELGAENIKRR